MRISISLVLTLIWLSLNAQSVVFSENFDLPSGADSITAGSSGGTNPSLGDTTGQLYVSASRSYQIKGSQTMTDVYFESQAFSTIGQPFVRLEFYHIAKLFSANQATLQISTNNGVSWTTINSTNSRYLGSDPSYPALGYFSQISYQTTTSSRWNTNDPFAQPDSGWFVKEIFDLTGIASDTSGGQGNFTGYANVKLRFNANFVFEIPPSQGFSAGWFIDDVKVTGSSCELSPPQISFDFITIPCYVQKPIGSVPPLSSNSYPVGVTVHDTMPYDSGVDSVVCFYRINNGAWLNEKHTLQFGIPQEYRVLLPGIMPGDSVDYYIMAWDLSTCGNSSRLPENGYLSFTPASYPSKCNTTLCSGIEVISSFPWTEDFEGPEWVAGFGSGDLANNNHRGDFPTKPDGPWELFPAETGVFGWSIRTGPTGTLNTGPSSDHTTGSGKYIYTEFSPNPSNLSNRGTILLTPCVDLTDSVPRMLSFYYHSYGADAGNIRIDIDTGSTATSFWLAYSRVKGPQQFSSSDPWKQAWVSLEPFIGKIIRIRFAVGVQNPNADEIDLAIDDLGIGMPPIINAQLAELKTSLTEPCDPTSSVPIKIRVRNLGSDSLTSIPVAYQLDNNPVVRDTLNGVSLALADSTSFVFGNLLSYSPGVSHSFKVWTELSGDIDNSDDTLQINIDPKTGNVSQFPYFLDFESSSVVPGGPGNLNDPAWVMNEGSSGGYFEVFEGLMDNYLEGPLQAMGKEAKAIRIRSNNSQSPLAANLRSNCFDLSAMSTPSLSFMHYVANGQTLEIRIKEAGGNWANLVNITGIAGFKESMSMSRITLSAYSGKIVQLEFRVNNQNPGDYTNQVVLDNIMIADAAQTDLGLQNEINELRRIPAGNLALPTFDVELTKSMNISAPGTQLNLEFSSLCDPNQSAITGLQSFTPSFPFNSAKGVRSINSLNLSDTLKPDRYLLKAWLNTANDTLHFNDTLYQEVLVQEVVGVPYFNDFENCNDQFLSNGAMRQWQKGSPSAGAFSGSNAYVTNLDTVLLTGSGTEKLIPPFVEGLDTLAGVEFRFYHRYNISFTGNNNVSDNYATIQYLDNGNWKPLVTQTNPPYTGSGMMYDSQLGYVFVGSSQGNWQYFMIPLDEAKKPGINIFRFLAKSSDPLTSNWEIDDFHIYVPPQNSAAPQELIFNQGIPRASNQVSLRLRNTGARLLNNAVASIYDQGGNLLLRDTLQLGTPTNPMLRNDTRVVNLNGQLALQPGNNELTIITSYPNQRNDAFPLDDTLNFSLEVLTEIDSLPYCRDFEASSELLSFTNGVSDNFWQAGTPAKTIMNGAYSGNQPG